MKLFCINILLLLESVAAKSVKLNGQAEETVFDDFRVMDGLSSKPVSPINGQIIGGKFATAGQFPWQIELLKDLSHQCGGSLIDSKWVVTAAHCVDGNGDYSVRLGTLNNKVDFEENRIQLDIPSDNIHIHEQYDRTTIANDIALIKLPVGVALPKTPKEPFYINSIKLPKRNEVKLTHEGKISISSGWGRVDPADLFLGSDNLKWISLDVISNAKCSETFGSGILTSNICIETNNVNGVCNGDSGGPLVIQGKDGKFTLIGVTSFVAGETCLGGPDVFTRVSSFLNWIKQTSGLKV